MPEWKAAMILPLIYWMESGGMWEQLYEHLGDEGMLIYQAAQLAQGVYHDSLKEFQ